MAHFHLWLWMKQVFYILWTTLFCDVKFLSGGPDSFMLINKYAYQFLASLLTVPPPLSSIFTVSPPFSSFLTLPQPPFFNLDNTTTIFFNPILSKPIEVIAPTTMFTSSLFEKHHWRHQQQKLLSKTYTEKLYKN